MGKGFNSQESPSLRSLQGVVIRNLKVAVWKEKRAVSIEAIEKVIVKETEVLQECKETQKLNLLMFHPLLWCVRVLDLFHSYGLIYDLDILRHAAYTPLLTAYWKHVLMGT